MPLAEQQRHAVFDDQPAQRIADAGAPPAEGDVFASWAALFVKGIRQDVVKFAGQDAVQKIQRARTVRIGAVPWDEGADRVEHCFSALCYLERKEKSTDRVAGAKLIKVVKARTKAST